MRFLISFFIENSLKDGSNEDLLLSNKFLYSNSWKTQPKMSAIIIEQPIIASPFKPKKRRSKMVIGKFAQGDAVNNATIAKY